MEIICSNCRHFEKRLDEEGLHKCRLKGVEIFSSYSCDEFNSIIIKDK